MKIRGRGLRVSALVMAGALTLAACGSDDEGGGDDAGATAGAAGGTYSFGDQTPQTLTPTDCWDMYCANILQGIATSLFTFQTEGTSMVTVPTPLLKSMTTPDEGKTYVIEINPGSKFTNGEAVTAQTFVDTFNFAANGGNGQQLSYVLSPGQLNVEGFDEVSGPDVKGKEMSGLKATSDTTFEMTLVAPLGQALVENYLAGPVILPMPSVAFEDIEAFNKQPIGNGPYMMTEPWSTTGVTLVRNPDYAYTPGKADQIDFRFYADTNALWADLQADNLDVTGHLPQIAFSQAAAVLGDRYINEAAMSFSYQTYPTQVDAFKNRDVRVALMKAVDWAEINDKIYYGTRSVATSFAPSSVPGGGLDVCGEDCTFDPVKAKELLDKAGGLPGNKVSIAGLANDENASATAQCNMIQKNLGVECEVKIFESFGEQLDAFEKLGADDEGLIVGLGWGADNPTLANMFATFFLTGSGNNYTRYSSPEFDRLIEEGNQAADEAGAIAKWQEAEQVIYKDFPGIATQWRNNVGAYSNNVSNVKINPGGYVNIAEITVNSAG